MTLSARERAYGQSRLRLFMYLNGLPVAFLMENVLVLYGIRNGMSDAGVAILASFILLTMPFMIFGRRLTSRLGLARAWGLAWGLRYASVFVLSAAPWVRELGQWATSGIILAGGFGFAFFRSLGAINNHPLVGEITTPDERGRYIHGNFARFHAVYLAALTLAVISMQLFDAMWVYQLLILIGVVIGAWGSYVLTTIPETDHARKAADEPIGKAARELFRDLPRRRTVWGFAAGLSAFSLTIPFATIAVKNGYGMPDHQALLLTLVIVAGGVLSSLVNREISDDVGPRPLIVLYTVGFFLVSLFWAFAPSRPLPVVVGLVFLAAGFCKAGLLVGLGHYLLSVTPAEQRFPTALFAEMVGGGLAGISASVVGGTLIAALQQTGEGIDVYRWYFRVIVIVMVGLVWVTFRLKRAET